MFSRTRTVLRIMALLAFASVTLGINFFHTETDIGGRNECPACHFLTSSISTSPGIVFVLPSLICQGIFASVEPLRTNEVFVISLCSRSPPQA